MLRRKGCSVSLCIGLKAVVLTISEIVGVRYISKELFSPKKSHWLCTPAGQTDDHFILEKNEHTLDAYMDKGDCI